MSKRSRLILGILIAGLVTFLTVRLYSSRPVIKLPNGSVLQLVDVTGTNQFVAGSVFGKLFGRWIPHPGVVLLGIHIERPETNTVALAEGPTLNLWFTSLKTSGPNIPATEGLQLRFIAFSLDGQSYTNSTQLKVTTSVDPPISLAVLSSFPRNQSRIGVRVLCRTNQSEWGKAAEFFVKNPIISSQENWIPEPIPITNEVDGITVVFGGCDIGTHTSKETEPSLYVQAKFQFLTNGIPTGNMTLSDATIWNSMGNFQHMESRTRQTRKDGWSNLTAPALELDGVWRLQARVVRRKFYPLDEFISLKDLPYNKAVVITKKAMVPITIYRQTESDYNISPNQNKFWLSVGIFEADGSFRRLGGQLSGFDSTRLNPGQRPVIALDEPLFLEYKFKPTLVEDQRATDPSATQ